MSFGVDGIIRSSMTMSDLKLQNQVGIAMMKKTMEQQEMEADLLLEQVQVADRRTARGSYFEARV